MTNFFKPATRQKNKAKIAIMGPSKSGKTWNALALAHQLAQSENGKQQVFLIDSENGRSLIYQGKTVDGVTWNWNHASLEPGQYAPGTYLQILNAAVHAGAAVVVIDSLSHCWEGTGGALDTKAALDARGGNSYTNWQKIKPAVNRLLEAINAAPCHVICTLRTKTEYELVANEKGKLVPQKIGTKPIVMPESDYEFDVVINVDKEHGVTCEARGCDALDGLTISKPNAATWKPYLTWLREGDGVAVETAEKFDEVVAGTREAQAAGNGPTAAPTGRVIIQASPEPSSGPPPGPSSNGVIASIIDLAKIVGWPPEKLVECCRRVGVAKLHDMPKDKLETLRAHLAKMATEKEAKNVF